MVLDVATWMKDSAMSTKACDSYLSNHAEGSTREGTVHSFPGADKNVFLEMKMDGLNPGR
jgi:hypothetical protein